MSVTPELVKAILAPMKPDEVSARLPEAIATLLAIGNAKTQIESDRAKEENRHQHALSELRRRLEVVRNSCPHYLTTYYGDPSGGSDSHTECDLCGKEL